MKARLWVLMGLGITATVAAVGQALGQSFSADVITTGPHGPVSTGRTFVSGDRMRLELEQGGRRVVTIVDKTRNVTWTLFPERKAYIAEGPEPGRVDRLSGTRSTNPCVALPDAACERVGEEEISGRVADIWEITIPHDGQAWKGTQWIDRERGVPLRQDMPGGVRSELSLVGMDRVGGRTVEKWELRSFTRNQAPTRSYQWYDPELGVAVRQELPGGYVSELKNIQLDDQVDTLFQIPADFQEVSMPGKTPGGR